jgi:cell division transport system permease protein
VIEFVAFSLKRAAQGYLNNKLMSVAATASMVLMLVLLSGLLILLTGLDATLKYVESDVEAVAYLRDSATTQDINQITNDLRLMPGVANVVYLSKDQALADFAKRDPKVLDQVQSLGMNPLPASLQISLRGPSDYAAVYSFLSTQKAVQNVQDIKKTVNQLISVINVLRTVGLIVLAIVGLTVLFIIINTIRLALVARAQEIEIMRLVGASDAFIRWPFIFEGALVGLVGAAITIALLLALQAPLSAMLQGFFNVVPVEADQMIGQNVAAIVLVSGIAIGVVGSYVSTRSYLAR